MTSPRSHSEWVAVATSGLPFASRTTFAGATTLVSHSLSGGALHDGTSATDANAATPSTARASRLPAGVMPRSVRDDDPNGYPPIAATCRTPRQSLATTGHRPAAPKPAVRGRR